MTGRAQVRQFHRYHRVLSRAAWSELAVGRVLLGLLVPIPWAARTWALPLLTALAPSARHDREQGRRHKTPTAWARQMLLVVRRWWPERTIVAVADSTDAALELPAACRAKRGPVTVATRPRLDAALYDPAPPTRPNRAATAEGTAAADARRGRRRSGHRLDRTSRGAGVWRRRARGRGRLRHGGLAPQRAAAGAPAPGADP